ncbi:MAG TPA: nucleotidyltransferase family protein [Bacteroidales bacterium]|nr:nucleotidyltransferase family protein [Bacteroidales bacterium]
MKAMILAAGLGTRLRPLTETLPKALVTVEGKTLLEHSLRHLEEYGIREVIINIHHLGGQIRSFLDEHHDFGLKITLSDESDALLDTGGGLKKASWFFAGDEPFLVRNVDVISGLDLHLLAESHRKNRALATLAVRRRETSRYLLFRKPDHRLCGWENRQTGEKIFCSETADNLVPLAFSGIQVISPEIFPLVTEEGKFALTGMYLRLARDHRILGYEENESRWEDAGKPRS